MDLILPRDLSTPGAAFSFVSQLPTAYGSEKVILDFSLLSFARPYATLVVAEGLRELVRARKRSGLETHVLRKGIFVGERESAVSYLGHVGFFKYVGVDYGNLPGEARGSDTYLPLTSITREELLATGKSVIQDAILDRCRRLAEMVLSDESEQDQFAYCLREIVRNVFEHAQVDRCAVMAQKYFGNQVEIAIADSGCGIQASLGEPYASQAPIEALKAAVRPGVTRVRGDQSGSKWDNTGFGLYVCSQIARESGSFALASSGALLTLSANGSSVREVSTNGTAVRLLINVSNAEYFGNRLQQIVDAGERQAAERQAPVSSASKSTRMSKEAG